ncbi:PLP-dependent aminotransferase family protein [Sporomusa sp.]|uniref:MocR-like pyridoxine biosynthesis transcription factor PdxR n=1 Tax=Sporomusa sp. TaxID=2078658 RepID=UPI002CC0C362|nr:PLP-dependent aminotransferase family protein [Sporomusa sp.]HWR44507.1 PLP-dependent aminotransferase family protein [Sporomusa sp.]
MFLLDAKSKIPLYRQLYQQLRAKILNGELSSQTKLPSNRKLCTDLCISRNTVDIAYQQLLSEGYIVAKPRSGYYVETIQNTILPNLAEPPQPEPPSKLLTEKIKYDFQYGKLSPQTFPFSQWQRLTNECLRNHKEQLVNYGSFMGELGLRKEIVKYLRDYRDVKCTVDQILIASGTKHCLSLACQLLKPVTSTIAIEDPGFASAHFTFESQGFQVQPVPVNHHGLNVKALRTSVAKAVYVTPSHQFPTGRIMSITRRLRLVEWAYEQDGFIIEDDYSCHLRYDVKPIPSLQGLAPDKVIYIGSFSKILLPSLRVAYMVLPKDLAERMHQTAANLVCSVPFLIQKPLELFMREGHFESHLRKMLRHFKKKHDTLVQALKDNFGDMIAISGINAGLHLLLQIKWPASTQDLVEKAAKSGVHIHAKGTPWIEYEPSPGVNILLGFSGIALENIPPAVSLLRKAWIENE